MKRTKPRVYTLKGVVEAFRSAGIELANPKKFFVNYLQVIGFTKAQAEKMLKDSK